MRKLTEVKLAADKIMTCYTCGCDWWSPRGRLAVPVSVSEDVVCRLVKSLREEFPMIRDKGENADSL